MASSGGPAEILAHLAGDYLIQTEWMATEKLRRHGPAAVHAATYTACFLPVTRNWRVLAVIGGTHFAIDRWRLAKYLIWAKNQAAPAFYRYPWSHAEPTGFHTAEHDMSTPAYIARNMGVPLRVVGFPPECTMPAKPEWLAGWLLITVDNCCHLLINRWALRRWGQR